MRTDRVLHKPKMTGLKEASPAVLPLASALLLLITMYIMSNHKEIRFRQTQDNSPSSSSQGHGSPSI